MSRKTAKPRNCSPSARRSRGWIIGLALALAGTVAITWFIVDRYSASKNQIAGGVRVPDPDTTEMEPLVAQRLGEARQAVLEQPDSAEAWGRFAKTLDVHRLHSEAIPCYRRAAALAPDEFRWAYFLARVIELVSDDLTESPPRSDSILNSRMHTSVWAVRWSNWVAGPRRSLPTGRRFKLTPGIAPATACSSWAWRLDPWAGAYGDEPPLLGSLQRSMISGRRRSLA